MNYIAIALKRAALQVLQTHIKVTCLFKQHALDYLKCSSLFLLFTAFFELALWSMKITFSFVHRKTLFNNAKESKETWDEEDCLFISEKNSGNILSYQMSASY